MVTIGPCRVIFESSAFLCLHRYISFTEEEPQYNGAITAITYQENKIFRQESSVQTLNYDPSNNQDWSWSDFE